MNLMKPFKVDPQSGEKDKLAAEWQCSEDNTQPVPQQDVAFQTNFKLSNDIPAGHLYEKLSASLVLRLSSLRSIGTFYHMCMCAIKDRHNLITQGWT